MGNILIKSKKKNKETFRGKFYVVDLTTETNGEWWVLRLSHNHYTMSAVQSKEKLIGCIQTIVKRYGDFNHLLRVLRKCEKQRHSEEVMNRLVEEYKNYRHSDLEGEVEDLISELENNKQKTKEEKEIRKQKILAKTKSNITPTKKPKKKIVTTDTPPIVNRHKKKKHKRLLI